MPTIRPSSAAATPNWNPLNPLNSFRYLFHGCFALCCFWVYFQTLTAFKFIILHSPSLFTSLSYPFVLFELFRVSIHCSLSLSLLLSGPNPPPPPPPILLTLLHLFLERFVGFNSLFFILLPILPFAFLNCSGFQFIILFLSLLFPFLTMELLRVSIHYSSLSFSLFPTTSWQLKWSAFKFIILLPSPPFYSFSSSFSIFYTPSSPSIAFLFFFMIADFCMSLSSIAF